MTLYPGHSAGSRVWVDTSSAYDGFGWSSTVPAEGQVDFYSPVGFGGQYGYYRDYTGLYLLTHRYYDAGAGRFVSRDPIGYKGGINLYGFAGNNPVNRMDPEGTQQALPTDSMAYVGNMFDNLTPHDWLHALKHNDTTRALGMLLNMVAWIPLPENPVADAKAVEAAEIVYRVIRADQVPEAGLVAKNVAAEYSVHAHVSRGSTLKTQFISTTKSLDVAMKYANRDGLRVVKIDLSKVHGAEVIDLTNPLVAQKLLHHPIPRGLANASQEVLIRGKIPANAISVIHTP